MTTITIIGGGLAGLAAAISCAEQGASVTLHEAHADLGGRGRSTAAPYIANQGVHAFYDGAAFRWLAARDLVQPFASLGVAQLSRMRFRHAGRLRRMPPPGLIAMTVRGHRRTAPVDRTFRDWATAEFGDRVFQAAAGIVGAALYDADPGRLSAAFVWERLLRVTTVRYPPTTRYCLGGWGSVISRMATRARDLGVRIETGSRITALPENGPVIVATSLEAAGRLLGDTALHWESGHAVLLDVAVRRARSDHFCVFDLDHGGFTERFSSQDPTLAPTGQSLIQSAMPIRVGESATSALARLRELNDLLAPSWRDRITWQRHQTARRRTGALDLPGLTWEDRPPIDRGNGVYLAGDMVAAPGLLSEVAIDSALTAARLATAQAAGRSAPVGEEARR